ncbi:MAG: hypothetical protein HY901_03635 [Deltaproteobacteria bacterium]|nr:hypothetical protein [Deltaproteobacteria bacterium]
MRALVGVLQAVVLLAYPLAVYFGLSRFSSRGVGLLVLVLLLPGLVKTLLQRRKELLATLGLPIAVAALMLLAVASNDERFVLAYPALVNLVLLTQFVWTLRPGTMSMVERFARLQVDDLPDREIAYCRSVTACWCAFFVLNGMACALFAGYASRSWWALYTGLLSYLALGLLFGVEFTVRKYLFRRYGPGLLDRAFALVFPPRAGP